jgi:hypothetical protein
MEPVSLTLGAIAAALIAKAQDKAADGAVEGTLGAGRRLVDWLRERFGADEDANRTVERLLDAPDSPSRAEALSTLLDARAEDPEFRGGLESLLRDAEDDGVDLVSVSQAVWGSQNVQSAHLKDSTINVSYGSSAPPKRP